MIQLDKYKTFTCSRDEDITPKLIREAIELHQTELVKLYEENENMYLSDHEILRLPEKEEYKPDNRLVINIPKYIVDTFEGYRMGIPVKIEHENETVKNFIDEFNKVNDMQDINAEASKGSSIYGHEFLYVYQDEDKQTRVAYETPLNMFIVYDDTIQQKELFAVRYQTQDKKLLNGEVITKNERIPILGSDNGIRLDEPIPHIYNDLPVVEVVANRERQGLFDSIKTLVNALNKALSEKANDVDYFADAYMHIDGQELDEEEQFIIRDNRVINTWGERAVTVSFLDKPQADDTQENLISHLWEMIFVVSMVANLSDEDFGQSSGTALAYKMQAMNNLAKTKDRKFEAALNKLYKIVFGVPQNGVADEDYLDLNYTFTRNAPRNLKEEAEVVEKLSGEVSEETKLKALSLIDNVSDEIDKMQKEDEEARERILQSRIGSRNLTDDALGNTLGSEEDADTSTDAE